ncbi:MAG: methionyl-tRNA formyltransferase [Cytophagales bacterium]|nr:methionyl-tRNA formyltransferase [Cytophagales bacterium]
MRIVYMGTPDFAVPALEILIDNNYNIAGVVTAPDKPQGRGLQLGESDVKKCAKKHGIPILQPALLKSDEFISQLHDLHADLQVVVAFRMLPEVVWNMPRLGTINLHASLLPQYRGAAPINWAIMNGEKETGVTTFFLKQEIDTGDIILQKKEPIYDTDTAGDLYNRLKTLGAQVVLDTVQQIADHKVSAQPQIFDKDLKTAPKIYKDMCKIPWHKNAEEVYNFVRGLAPYPTAHCTLNGNYCKIFEVEYSTEDLLSVGMIASDQKSYLHIGCGQGYVGVKKLQMEGQKILTINQYLSGNKVTTVL